MQSKLICRWSCKVYIISLSQSSTLLSTMYTQWPFQVSFTRFQPRCFYVYISVVRRQCYHIMRQRYTSGALDWKWSTLTWQGCQIADDNMRWSTLDIKKKLSIKICDQLSDSARYSWIADPELSDWWEPFNLPDIFVLWSQWRGLRSRKMTVPFRNISRNHEWQMCTLEVLYTLEIWC